MRTKGFGLLLKHMLGSIATTGPTDSTFTHTASLAAMQGLGLTYQKGVGLEQNTLVEPFTYNGGKVTKWQLECALDGILMLKVSLDGQNETQATALAVAVYPSGDELLTFVGGSITIAGAVYDVIKKITITCDNTLAADRRFLRGSALQKEQMDASWRNIDVTIESEFQSLTQYNRYAAATAAGTLAAVVATWTGPTLAGASTFPSLTVTMPACRFDGKTPVINGVGLLDQPLKAAVLNTAGGTNDAITLAYVTTDSTP